MNHEMSNESLTENISENITEDTAENIIETKPPSPPRRMIWLILGLMFLMGLGLFIVNASATKPEKGGRNRDRGKQVTPVTVALVTQKTVPVQLQAIGNVQSGATVSITPQTSGRIIGVYFRKGQLVKKGQLLFTLDDRTQNASIQQAEAVLAKDQAQIEQARANLAKDQGQVEQARTNLAKDQGQVEQARTNLAKDQGLVRQARATLVKDEAQAKYAQDQSKRYHKLYKSGAISQDQAQQYFTNEQISAATLQADREAIANAEAVVKGDKVAIANAQEVVKGDIVAIANAQAVVKGDLAAIQNAEAVKRSDQGALDNLKVQSSYTKIYAPIDGQVGNILVNQGNVVQTNSTTPLATITKTRPIQVAFSIPEGNLPQVQKYMENGRLKVDVNFSGKNNSIPGTLSFVNNTVDNSTGTIQLIGDFDNAEGQLFPGQFVNTTLTLTQTPNATVVPAQAVQNGPDGQFVFVVKPDTDGKTNEKPDGKPDMKPDGKEENFFTKLLSFLFKKPDLEAKPDKKEASMKVESVPVTVSNTIDGFDVIEKGVEPGDQVVTDGQANLTSGSKIRIKTAASEADENNTGNDSSKRKGHHRGKRSGNKE